MIGQRFNRIYLDNCTLCRPYDDQDQVRIRLETDAVFLILAALKRGQYRLVVSPVHFQEIGVTEDAQERADVEEILKTFGERARIRDMAEGRREADRLCDMGLGVADAAHFIFAMASADCLVSCDDRFLKRARKAYPDYPIFGPVEFCEKERLT